MSVTPVAFENPFRPGAGHMPPHLAGRGGQIEDFRMLLKQKPVLQNLIVTGLRGVGKTVLLETYRPIARSENWLWVGTDLSEAASATEESLATRLLTDLSVVTEGFSLQRLDLAKIGFKPAGQELPEACGYGVLRQVYDATPGLTSDKLKRVFAFVWECAKDQCNGLVFAYDEAQSMSDHDGDKQYPLSMMLDVFQSVQRQGILFMLLLTGLPTLFPGLVKTRTYSERMFHTQFLDRLTEDESEEAIRVPIKACPVGLKPDSIKTIVRMSGGYPYFIQFIAREAYDNFLHGNYQVSGSQIERKLDTDFFEGRWANLTDRQRQLLWVVAHLPTSDEEFSVREIVEESRRQLEKGFTASHVNQILGTLAKRGLVYRNRHGRYILAVPLLSRFIRRQELDYV